MPEIDVRNLRNEAVGKVSLPDEVFSVPLHRHLLYEAVRAYRNRARAGTHDTKNRKEISGGTRKLWRQKHTGRARMGDNRSPLWRKGGTVHGPQPRSYEIPLPKKVRRGALRSALSEKIREGRLVVVDALSLEEPKTKALRRIVEEGFGIRTSVLLVCEEENRNLELAARNLPRVKVTRALGLNAYDLLRHEWLLASRAALERIGEVLSAGRRESPAEPAGESEA